MPCGFCCHAQDLSVLSVCTCMQNIPGPLLFYCSAKKGRLGYEANTNNIIMLLCMAVTGIYVCAYQRKLLMNPHAVMQDTDRQMTRMVLRLCRDFFRSGGALAI